MVGRKPPTRTAPWVVRPLAPQAMVVSRPKEGGADEHALDQYDSPRIHAPLHPATQLTEGTFRRAHRIKHTTQLRPRCEALLQLTTRNAPGDRRSAQVAAETNPPWPVHHARTTTHQSPDSSTLQHER